MLLSYDEDGRIMFAVTTADRATIDSLKNEELSKGYSTLELENSIDVNNFYVDIENNNTLIPIPTRQDFSFIFNYKTKVWEQDLEITKTLVNNQRLALLTASDWTDTVSAQTRLSNWQEWQDYRQALRDIPQQEGYPLNVIFPTQPN